MGYEMLIWMKNIDFVWLKFSNIYTCEFWPVDNKYILKLTCTHFVLRLFLDSSSTIPVGKGRVEEESRKSRRTKCVQISEFLKIFNDILGLARYVTTCSLIRIKCINLFIKNLKLSLSLSFCHETKNNKNLISCQKKKH
ncbi:hypothetical protein BpHYR1_023905 [Brachionus plicatilis]|uniref:Uncharacterized protein n=1 Tax=Brachionus plicatilis TaxID=10195 RepID=A0A3M7R6G4_BRAPC|nr:hypothetical protein BpHYR1_023905 [Brachionus plicatilis]